jgi:tetratricopeptide (TPR) repeat protein
MKFNTKNSPLPKHHRLAGSILLAVAFLLASCTQNNSDQISDQDMFQTESETTLERPMIEATSLNGEGLVRPDFDPETTSRLTNNLREAIENYSANPDDPQSIIWVARHTAYLWRYQDAIYILTDGLKDYPDDPRFYRHRGHRYITIREFDKAIEDLEKASELIEGTKDEVEPDGAPNSANIPVSTLHFNVYYHLGLAYYLTQDFEKAAFNFEKALFVSENNDTKVSATDWLYISLMKDGQTQKAQELLSSTDTNIEVIESQSYLSRLQVYKGEIEPEELLKADNELNILTQGYGLAQYYYLQGDTSRADQLLQQVIDTNYWAAFGYIAAEVDMFGIQNQD